VRNYALERARGRYLYCLDDDDACFPGALASLQEVLDHQKQVGVAFGQVKATGPDRQTRESYDRWWSWAARIARQVSFSSWLTAGIILFRGTLIINSACMIRRTAASTPTTGAPGETWSTGHCRASPNSFPSRNRPRGSKSETRGWNPRSRGDWPLRGGLPQGELRAPSPEPRARPADR
jgi:hypothetical protein